MVDFPNECPHGKIFICVECIGKLTISPRAMAAAEAATVRIDADNARRALLTEAERKAEDEVRIQRLAHDLAQFTD